MVRLSNVFWIIGLSVAFWHCTMDKSNDLSLRDNMIIRKSVTIDSATYQYYRSDSISGPVLRIEGENLDIDFNHATLVGNPEINRPDLFQGTALIIENGHHITIRNLKVRGYKIAILAEGIHQLELINCDLSYNFRQKMGSIREREDLGDWLYYHENENDEWLRYGAGAYLKYCDHAILRDNKISQGQNGILMIHCDSGLVYNNNIQYNSGLGLGMYRSSYNKIMHNRFDFNVRGYSHGIYKRGQDSAGILLYEQCNKNIIAFNSATHSGDGLFLWAGNQTMNTGEGGCNNNMIYRNDFSYAPTNGIEVTFSQNILVENKMVECRYGIWAGYSHHTLMEKNIIKNCDFGIAVEHGHHNDIVENLIENSKIGIQLWERQTQPENWGFAQKRNISSKHYRIIDNKFKDVNIPTDIKQTTDITFINNTYEGENHKKPGSHFENKKSEILSSEKVMYTLPSPLQAGLIPKRSKDNLDGRKYIIVNEWGPYNYEYPLIWLREIQEDRYVFALFGPEGNWRVTNVEGFNQISQKTGRFPNSLIATKSIDAGLLKIGLEFIGAEFIDQLGNKYNRGQVFSFAYNTFIHPLVWDIYFYQYKPDLLPIQDSIQYQYIIAGDHLHHTQTQTLAFTWWSSPHENVPEDHFITISKANGNFSPGNYSITLISDDGVRMFIDNKLLLNDWSIHTPRNINIQTKLDGKHFFTIEHFDEGGLANLDFRIEKIDDE